LASLKDARKAKGLTQEEVADKAGIKHKTYWAYENGTISPPAAVAARIQKVLGVEVPLSKPPNGSYASRDDLSELRGQVKMLENRLDKMGDLLADLRRQVPAPPPR
jgi:transcriptional regulator with XRE-family HTH domain